MNRVLLLIVLAVVTASAVGIVSTRAADNLDRRLAGYPEFRFRLTAERIEAPAEVSAGRVLLIEESEGELAGHAFIFRVPDDVSDDELAAVLSSSVTAAEEAPAWFYQAWFVGNGDRATANRPAISLADLKPGRYVIGDPYRPPTDYAVFEAVAAATESSAVAAAPQPDVAIDLFEMDFTIPDDIKAGRQVWQVTNSGAMLHEVAHPREPSGETKAAEVEAVLAGGEAAFGAETTPAMRAAVHAIGLEWTGWTLQLAGGVGVLSPQGMSWAQLDLAPGTYAAVCFIPGPDGTPHFMAA